MTKTGEVKKIDFYYKYPKSLWEFIGTPPTCAETEELLQWKQIVDRYRYKWLSFLQHNEEEEENSSSTFAILYKEQKDFLHRLVLDSHYYKLKASPEHTQKKRKKKNKRKRSARQGKQQDEDEDEVWTDSHRLEFVLYENMFISMDDMVRSEVRRKALHNCQELLRQLRLQNQLLERKQKQLEEEQQQRVRQEQERLQREQEEEKARKLEEQKRKAAAEAAERKRLAEEAAERYRKAEEAERKRKAEEAERKRKAEEAERKRKAEEAERIAAAERKRKAEEAEQKRRAQEAERKRRAEEEAARKRRAEEAERKRKAEEAAERKRRAEEAERKRRAEEAERKRKAEEAERKRRAEEAERKRKAEEEAAERKRKAEEAERKRKAEEAERKRRAEEEERKAAAERKRRAEEAERKRLREEEERKRQEAERKRKQEEERKRQQEERRRREEAERKRKQEARRRQEEQRRREEAERKRQEEEKRRQQEEEQRKRQEEKRRREEEQKRQDERRRQQQEQERQQERQRQEQERIRQQQQRQRANPAPKKASPLIIEIADSSSDEDSVAPQPSEQNSTKVEKPPAAAKSTAVASVAPDRLARVLDWLNEKVNIQTRRVTVAEQQRRRQYKHFFPADRDNNFSLASSAPRSAARIKFDQSPLTSMEIDSAIERFQIWEPYWLTHNYLIIGKTCPVQKVEFQSTGEEPSRAFAASIAIPSHIRKLISYRHENKPQNKYDHGEHRLLLRALPLKPPGENKKANKKRPRADYHLWPKGTFLQLQNPTKIEQRSHDRTEWNGMSKPLDVSQILLNRTSPGTELQMHLCTYDDEPYIICLSLCEFISPQRIFQVLTGVAAPNASANINSALESVLPRVPHLSHDDALALAVHKAKANHFAIDDDDDDEGSANTDLSSIIFPLVDPSTSAVLKTPVRSRKCQHFQCFNLETFLFLNCNITGTRYKCPVCGKLINIWDLYICDLTDKMIETKQSEITSSRNRIQLFSDGTWKLLPEKIPSTRKRHANNTSQRSAVKVQKTSGEPEIIDILE